MRSHRYPTNRRRRDVLWACALLAVAVFGGGVAYAAATGQVTCAPGADLLVHGDGTWTCGPDPSPSTSPTATPSPSGSPTPAPTSPQPTTPAPTTNPPTTTTAPPTSPPAALRDCLHQLAACGYPNDLNTGPVLPLTVSSRTQYTTAGETVSGVDIRGCVDIRADNVTFRNVRFTAAGCFWAVRSLAAGALLEDVEIDCGGTPGSNGYSNAFTTAASATLRRADIHDCENGLNVPGNTTVVDSWIHNLYDQGSAHADGAQFNQGAVNITFSHNTIDARGNTTSAIIMWDEADPQNRDVNIADNLMAGGAYTLYCGRSGTVDNIRVTNNRFGPGQFGYANACNSGETWFGNVRDSDSATLGAA